MSELPQHKDPELYDLPRGNWLCGRCMLEAFNVTTKSAGDYILEAYQIESVWGKLLSERYPERVKRGVKFYNADDVKRALQERKMDPLRHFKS